MNKTAIKNFAVWARNKLIADITYKAGLIGVSEKGIAQPLPQSSKDLQFFDIGTKDYAQVAGRDIEQRNALVRAIQEKEANGDYATAFKAVVEEVAYTWFNRLIAIRFMEVNEYLPSRIRVLSSENSAKNEPDFVTTPFDTDMEFTAEEQNKIMQLKDENKLDELFRMLFVKQCNKLHEILPELFEETNNYTELLLSISFTDSDGVVYHLVHDIDEDDFNVEKEGQVEIIGWLYQYYNIEPKDETFALLKKNVKITKERIPAATQLFTPDWIVRYMVENSLGRLWVEGHPSDSLKENWKYYLEEAEQEADVRTQLEQIRAEYRNLNPEDIKVIDPCMGSGHILVYCFDVLMQIYESQGYTQRDAAQSILENNLFGLDIDKRAAQLSYFAVMMKARQYDRRIFGREVKPQVYAIEESNGINRGQLKYFGANLNPTERNKAKTQVTGLLDTMVDAKEYGSILNVENYDWDLLQRFAKSTDDVGQMSLDTIGIDQTQLQMKKLIQIARVMVQKYDVVVTNPPYMGASNMNAKLSAYLKNNYPDTKTDLFSACMEKGILMTKNVGFCCMVTMQSWMFLGSFEKMRNSFLSQKTITNLLHMDNMVMGIAFGTAVTIFCNKKISNYKGTYNQVKLGDIVDGIPKEFPISSNRFYKISIDNLCNIPGMPIAYWISDRVIEIFNNKNISDVADAKTGLQTGNNDKYLKLWFEVNRQDIDFYATNDSEFKHTWYPHVKGGDYRKWYGNYQYVILWKGNGIQIKNEKGAVIRSPQYYFNPGITWSHTTSGGFSGRLLPEHFVINVESPSIFNSKNPKYLMGLLNSKVGELVFEVMNSTMHYLVGNVAKVPVVFDEDKVEYVEEIVEENIFMAKEDWDAFETSWDFKKHPLLCENTVENAYKTWNNQCSKKFEQLKLNEEKLNNLFIDIYGLQNELIIDVEEKM